MKIKMFLAFCMAFVAMTFGAYAQTNSFPDATSIYTSLASPFNSALGWVIGAIAVMTLIGWILKAVRRR
jgi:uncharacterized membrane protein